MTTLETLTQSLHGHPLPKGWRMVRLEEVCRVFAGGPAPQDKRHFAQEGPLFIRVSDLGRHARTSQLRESQDHLSEAATREWHLVYAKAGTVLFPKSGAAITTNNRALLAVDGYIVSHLMALEPKRGIISDWLYYAMCQIDMMDCSDNSGYPSLKQSQVKKIIIPLPPLSEQQRIVAILREQMAAVEKARAAAQARLEAVKALPAAFLRQVFPQPGQSLPEGWRMVRLGDVCYQDRQIVEARSQEAELLPYLSLEHVESNTGRILPKPAAPIDDQGLSTTFRFTPDHVLYGKLRPYLNKVALPDFNGRCTTEMIPLRSNGQITRDFLALVLRRQETVEFAMQGKTGSRMPRADMTQLLGLEIPLPPLAEQKRIAAMLREQMAAVEKARAAAEAELDAINALPAALLRRAFSGGL